MSDRASSNDIDAVLASIRQLVAEGESAKPQDSALKLTRDMRTEADPDDDHPAAPDHGEDRLVLSPRDEITQDQTEAPSLDEADIAELRAIVAEIVREELRGDLGRTMTSNIRRLVRREVMQALGTKKKA